VPTPTLGIGSAVAINAILAVLLCVGFSFLFNRGIASTALRPAILRSALFLVGALCLDVAMRRQALQLDVLLVITVTAVFLDIRSEWHARRDHGDLVAVWPIHQAARLDETLSALAAANIPVHPRAANHRVLYHFFGPYLPIDLLVPRDRVAAASDLLASLTKR
jgi:hypothetical protein